MRRRTFIKLAGATALTGALAAPAIARRRRYAGGTISTIPRTRPTR